MKKEQIIWDPALIKRYDLSGPRYTSYPTALEFTQGYTEQAIKDAASIGRDNNRPLSFYVHIPFCAHLCYYCACNKIITKRREKAQPYLDLLYKEIAMQADIQGQGRVLEQLHWGGGTPTFISEEQMTELMGVIGKHFTLLDDDKGDYSIEIDPRELNENTLPHLRKLGFNRISLGVQDFDEKVQKAVNRIQPQSMTQGVLDQARELGFRSINLDLIYGLPHQTEETFAHTVDTVIAMSPDRLSVFNYAHLPERFMPQRRINEADIPSPESKLKMFQNTINKLMDAGYQYIGMDHFAKPDDKLAIAQQQGKLQRNFQGYSTHGDCDLIATGVSAISQVGNSYYQNFHTMEDYCAALEKDDLPVTKGLDMTNDDLIRRALIRQLICHFELDGDALGKRFDIDFADYFADELSNLKQMIDDGLVTRSGNYIEIQPAGRLLVRSICMNFDAHMKEALKQRFSRII